MHDPQDQHAPDVSTEPQRQALDAMSRQLVERLNEMVREQHERARRFAATQHSLSPLPQLPELSQSDSPPSSAPYVPELPADIPVASEPPAYEPDPEPAQPHRKATPLPPRPRERKLPQEFPAKPFEAPARPNAPIQQSRWQVEQKKEDGCGALSTLIFIILVVITLRACS